MKKKVKTINFVESYREPLALLASRPEFKALEKLIEVEERNIVYGSFKINSCDPNLGEKKAHFEGRLYELRKIRRTFEESLKEVKKEEE